MNARPRNRNGLILPVLRAGAGAFACALACGSVFAAAVKSPASTKDPREVIKQYKFEVQRVEYHDDQRRDPFEPLVPLKREVEGEKVRIATLKLSSVIAGKQKVAIFRELHGPTFSYILINGVLLGSDRKPIPGIEGTIEPVNKQGEYRVILKQGAERAEYNLVNRDLMLMEEKAARERTKSAGSGQDK